MKHFILLFLVPLCFKTAIRAQNIDSIYVNLYTDSLKKGTYNYINIDGLLSNGRYLPLDSTQLIFSASAGKFSGNSLWLDPNFTAEKVSVKVILRSNPAIYKEFEILVILNMFFVTVIAFIIFIGILNKMWIIWT